MVIPHSVLVAIWQGKGMWTMFGFGFSSVFVVTYMHGLNLPKWLLWTFGIVWLIGLFVAYILTDKLN